MAFLKGVFLPMLLTSVLICIFLEIGLYFIQYDTFKLRILTVAYPKPTFILSRLEEKHQKYFINITGCKEKAYEEASFWMNRKYPTEKYIYEQQNFTLFHSPVGRFGNLLFQFSSQFILAHRYNRRLLITPRMVWTLRSVVQLKNDKRKFGIKRKKPKNAITIKNFRKRNLGTFYNRLSNFTNIKAFSFFEHWRIIERNKTEIRKLFTLQSELNKTMEYKINEILHNVNKTRNNTIVIGIHVRRGDYTNIATIPKPLYFHNAMGYYREKYKNVHFILVGEDTKWNRKNFQNVSDLSLHDGSYVHDFALLSICDHSIISIGTFGFWVGWLAGGEVVYFKTTHTKFIHQKFQICKTFPPYWIPMDDTVNYSETSYYYNQCSFDCNVRLEY